MSSEIIWSVLGISVSVIFGAIGIYLTVRSRYPGRITFVNEQTIELFDAIGNSLDKLSVSYDGNDVNENLILINGAFINSGKIDLTPSMVEEPINLVLPDGYKWLTGRIVDSPVKASIEINNNSISISTGLFRCGEYVKFHALAQLPDSDEDISNSRRLKNALKFSHRITNTKSIDEVDVRSHSESKKELKRRGYPFLFMFVAMFGVLGFALYKGIPMELVFPYQISNSSVEMVKVRTTDNEMLDISSVESEFIEEVEYDSFVSKLNGPPVLQPADSIFSPYLAIALNFTLILILLLILVYEYIKNKRILKIIDS